MDNLIDTLMNLFVFAFVGLLVWLYLKPKATERNRNKNGSHKDF